VGQFPTAVAIADFDGDGKLDVAVTNVGGNNLCPLLGNGDGFLRPEDCFGVNGAAVAIAIADFNGDGKPDAAVAGSGNIHPDEYQPARSTRGTPLLGAYVKRL
jgi:hypothetical protein